MTPVVLITGGSSGIGHAIAMKFLGGGYRVAVTGRDMQRLTAAFSGLDTNNLLCIEADAHDVRRYGEVVDRVLGVFGRLDVLVNNVGGGSIRQTLQSATVGEWDRVMDLNAKSTFFMIQASLPALRATQGSVVNFSSVLASRPVVGLGPYSAAKAAVDMITQTAALELAPEGIRVNCVAPATVQTGFHTAAGMSDNAAYDYYISSRATHPIGRVGEPQDVAEMVYFLSDRSKAGFITGTTVQVDGGRLLTSAVAAGLAVQR